MSKDFKFEFYRLVMPESSANSFEQLINQLLRTPLSSRIRSILDRPVYLYESQEETVPITGHNNQNQNLTLLSGMIIRVKTDDLPDWVDNQGSLQPLEDDDEKLGLGEKSVFLYNPETRVFIFQRTQSGASLKAMFQYFEEVFSLETSIQTRPCLNEDAMSRIDNLKQVKRFELKIASLDSMEVFSDRNDADEIDRLRKETRAPFLHLTLSVEHKSTSLDVEYIVNTIKAWLPFTSGSKERKTDIMRLNGSTMEGGNFVMDLIEDKMKESVNVRYTSLGGRKHVEDSERYTALLTAWGRRKESIIKMYMHPSQSGRI